jgi:hypothetical protein
MDFSNIKYAILGAAEVNSIDFSQVNEDSANTLRYSLDNSTTFVSFTGDTPSFLSSRIIYSHKHVYDLVRSPLWIEMEIEIE